MNPMATAHPHDTHQPDFTRSEAFAEDLAEFCPAMPDRRRSPRWLGLLNLLPVVVALVGVAFAVLPGG